MSAHTPGPWLWEYRRGGEGQYNMEVYSATHGVIATCAWTPRPLGNGATGTYRDANARLIAAAPYMLSALEYIRSQAVPGDVFHAAADAAIATATGVAT